MQKKLTALEILVTSYATVLAVTLISLAIASPWIAAANGNWIGVPFCIVLGVMGGWLLAIEHRDHVRALVARHVARRAARQRALEELTSCLTRRPIADTFVRVLEPTWTPFGTLHPDDLGVVLDAENDDEHVVFVRWKYGEAGHDYRHLAAEVYA